MLFSLVCLHLFPFLLIVYYISWYFVDLFDMLFCLILVFLCIVVPCVCLSLYIYIYIYVYFVFIMLHMFVLILLIVYYISLHMFNYC